MKTPEGFKKLDFAAISTEIQELRPVMENLIKNDEIKELTTNFRHAYCVLVLTMKYTPNNDSFIGKYENFR
mgnify:CR=1 FL=1